MAKQLNPITNWFKNVVGRVFRKSFSLTDAKFVAKLSGSGTESSVFISEETALRIATVWCCVRIIAESSAMLPFQAFRNNPRTGSVEPIETETSLLIGQMPNAEQTSVEFVETLISSLCLAGNSYNERSRSSLDPLTPPIVRPRRENGAVVYDVFDGITPRTVQAADMWHVKGFGSGGIVGLSPIGQMREALGLAVAAEKTSALLMSQGARPTGAFTYPTWLPDDKRDAVKDRLATEYAGLSNVGRFIVLENGFDFKPFTMDFNDAQFIEQRRYQTAEICRLYRVPLHMVMEMEGSTNNNIEYQGLSFLTYTLMPYLTRIERSAARWLRTPSEIRNGVFYRFNVAELLRADSASRGIFYASMLQNGVYSRNEVRAFEKMPRVEGLDDYTIQTNLTPAALLAQIWESQINNRTGGNSGA